MAHVPSTAVVAAKAALQAFPAIAIATPVGTLPLPVVMVAIAGVESDWVPTADGDCGYPGPACGTCTLTGQPNATSWGLWQIHNVHAALLTRLTGSSDPCTWRSWLHVPAHNAQAAYAVYQEQGLGAWTSYGSGAWQQQVAVARQAVILAGGSAGSPGGGGTSSGGGSGGSPAPPGGSGSLPGSADVLGVAAAVLLIGGGLWVWAQGGI